MDAPPSRPNFRFAPSPNGYLHLGHAYSALCVFAMARETGGQFIVRIEDIDMGRCREAYVAAIFEDLAWLGFSWLKPVLRQSHRFPAYQKAVDRLLELGVLYPCFATRTEISRAVAGQDVPLDPDGAPIYPGLYRDLPQSSFEKMKREGRPFALRIHMEKALELARDRVREGKITFTELSADGERQVVVARPERWGDAVIVRKDVPASYHLAVVLDDAFQGVSIVTRGSDLYEATDIHRLLQILLDLPVPEYHHHALVTVEGSYKLSKSKDAETLRSLRDEGTCARDIIDVLGFSELCPFLDLGDEGLG